MGTLHSSGVGDNPRPHDTATNSRATDSNKSAFYADRNQRPVLPPPNFDAIPSELRDAPRWVQWRLVWKATGKGGKWDKRPFRPDGRAAKTNDATTWATFAEVAAYRTGGFDGVGFVLGDGFAGIDLDDVRDFASGALIPDAVKLVERCSTYTEVSPSGTGVKLIGRGEWNAGWHRRPFDGGGEIEVYSSGRYFTVTGNSLGGRTVSCLQLAFGELADRFTRRDQCGRTNSPELTDDELIQRATAASNGHKFAALWRGDATAYDGDESRADAALCVMLAFWCDRDAGRIDRLFRRSGLMRPKWDERRGESAYGARTIAHALELQTESFASSRPGQSGATTSAGARTPLPSGGAAGPQSAAAIILAYFREKYRPVFRRGNAIVTHDGEDLSMNTVCGVSDSRIIAQLADATDAPKYEGGGVRRGSLPRFYSTWTRVAWGDLLGELPDEDSAESCGTEPVREQFRQWVREALLIEVVLGDVIGCSNVTQTERRSLIGWCERFAKPGRWGQIRSKECWCKRRETSGGEIRLQVAIRHELFSQLRAHRRLCEMKPNTFSRRAERYGVGCSSREDRPGGRSAVVLNEEFVADLVSDIPPDTGESPEG